MIDMLQHTTTMSMTNTHGGELSPTRQPRYVNQN